MFILWSVTKRALVMISNSFGGCNLALALSTPGQVTRAGESVPAEALPGADHNDVSPRSFLSDTTPRSSRPKTRLYLDQRFEDVNVNVAKACPPRVLRSAILLEASIKLLSQLSNVTFALSRRLVLISGPPRLQRLEPIASSEECVDQGICNLVIKHFQDVQYELH